MHYSVLRPTENLDLSLMRSLVLVIGDLFFSEQGRGHLRAQHEGRADMDRARNYLALQPPSRGHLRCLHLQQGRQHRLPPR